MPESHENHCPGRSPAPFKRVVVVHNPSAGSAPVYSVVVNGDGSVLYNGRRQVIQDIRDQWQVSQDNIEAIARAIAEFKILSLSKTGSDDPGEGPGLTVAVRMPGDKPVVVDNGENAEVLERFADRVGKLAGLKGYVPGM